MAVDEPGSLGSAMAVVHPDVGGEWSCADLRLVLERFIGLNYCDREVSSCVRLQVYVPQKTVPPPPPEAALQRPAAQSQHHHLPSRSRPAGPLSSPRSLRFPSIRYRQRESRTLEDGEEDDDRFLRLVIQRNLQIDIAETKMEMETRWRWRGSASTPRRKTLNKKTQRSLTVCRRPHTLSHPP